jgi:hypothetical protein
MSAGEESSAYAVLFNIPPGSYTVNLFLMSTTDGVFSLVTTANPSI